MKIKNKKLSKKAIVIIAAIVLLAGLSTAGAYYYFDQQKDPEDTKHTTSSKEDKPATKEQKESGEAIKNQSVNAPEPQPAKPNATPPENPTPPAPPASSGSVQVDITAASQNNSTGIYQLRALIHSVQGEGTCRLVLTKGGAQVVKEVSVQPLPSSSTCRGFDIPLSELSAGQWQAHLTFSNARVSGATSKTITIQ